MSCCRSDRSITPRRNDAIWGPSHGIPWAPNAPNDAPLQMIRWSSGGLVAAVARPVAYFSPSVGIRKHLTSRQLLSDFFQFLQFKLKLTEQHNELGILRVISGSWLGTEEDRFEFEISCCT